MKSLVEFIYESKIDPQEVIDAIIGSYEQWREDMKDEPGEWSDMEDSFNAEEPDEFIINDLSGYFNIDSKELEKFFKTSQGKMAWKKAQKEF